MKHKRIITGLTIILFFITSSLFLSTSSEGVLNELDNSYEPSSTQYVGGLDYLEVDEVWQVEHQGNTIVNYDYRPAGQSVRIAVIDSGIDLEHPDLGNNPGIEDGVITDGSGTLDDVNGHGTMVSGIIAACGDLIGIAPKAEIIPIKYSDSAYDAIAAAVDFNTNADPTDNIDIISMSLESSDSGILTKIGEAIDNGIIVVVASGNYVMEKHNGDPSELQTDEDTKRNMLSSALSSNTITVGAINHQTEERWYDELILDDPNNPNPYDPLKTGQGSKYGWALDFVTPGDHILTTAPTESYKYYQDRALYPNYDFPLTEAEFLATSCATPFISGLIAVLLSAHPEINNDIDEDLEDIADSDVYEALQNSIDTLTWGNDFNEETGWGCPNAQTLINNIAAEADPDGDGLYNGLEDIYGTDRNCADTDGDGQSDLYELIEGTDPNPSYDYEDDFSNDNWVHKKPSYIYVANGKMNIHTKRNLHDDYSYNQRVSYGDFELKFEYRTHARGHCSITTVGMAFSNSNPENNLGTFDVINDGIFFYHYGGSSNTGYRPTFRLVYKQDGDPTYSSIDDWQPSDWTYYTVIIEKTGNDLHMEIWDRYENTCYQTTDLSLTGNLITDCLYVGGRFTALNHNAEGYSSLDNILLTGEGSTGDSLTITDFGGFSLVTDSEIISSKTSQEITFEYSGGGPSGTYVTEEYLQSFDDTDGDFYVEFTADWQVAQVDIWHSFFEVGYLDNSGSFTRKAVAGTRDSWAGNYGYYRTYGPSGWVNFGSYGVVGGNENNIRFIIKRENGYLTCEIYDGSSHYVKEYGQMTDTINALRIGFKHHTSYYSGTSTFTVEAIDATIYY